MYTIIIRTLQFILRLYLSVSGDSDDHGSVLHQHQAPDHGPRDAPRLPRCEPRHRALLDSP